MMIEDIERNNYCFTDGNGLVSKGLAKLINQPFFDRIIPSAYQIRVAGCKGLIIMDPQSTFEQFYIKIRPSMKKFQCDNWSLEICGYSHASNLKETFSKNLMFRFKHQVD
jgi:RNA-dependent RNA polymerase